MAGQRNGRLPLIKLDNGITYEGEWLDDKPHGRGIRISLFGRLVRLNVVAGSSLQRATQEGGRMRARLDVCVNGCADRAR